RCQWHKDRSESCELAWIDVNETTSLMLLNSHLIGKIASGFADPLREVKPDGLGLLIFIL
ncbi:MAG: hypothetical protein RI896_1542, partial [Pseudomonadota bacterium]